MICILDPLTCGFTKVLVYELFTSDFGVQLEGNKKVWQGNVNKNDSTNSENVTLTIAKMIPVVTKHSSTNFQISLKTSSLWERKIQLPKNQFYQHFRQTPGLI